MKKSIFALFSILILVLTVLSCQNPENLEEAETFSVTFDNNGIGTCPQKIENLKMGAEFIVPEMQAEGYKFLGWYDEETLFKVGKHPIAKNLKLLAKWQKWFKLTDKPVFIDSNIVEFGDFPQSLSAENLNYEANEVIINTMRCKKGSDGFYHTELNGKYYKIEPIRWRILDSHFKDADGKEQGTLLYSEKALTACQFYDNTFGRMINEQIEPNDYNHSKLRAYLLGRKYQMRENESSSTLMTNTNFVEKGFLQQAFTSKGRYQIIEVKNDNSKASLGNNADKIQTTRLSDPTWDQIFVLSGTELEQKYFKTNTERQREATDFAKAQGLAVDPKNRVRYWSRTPFTLRAIATESRGNMKTVDGNGEIKNTMTNGKLSQESFVNQFLGVVPALVLKK